MFRIQNGIVGRRVSAIDITRDPAVETVIETGNRFVVEIGQFEWLGHEGIYSEISLPDVPGCRYRVRYDELLESSARSVDIIPARLENTTPSPATDPQSAGLSAAVLIVTSSAATRDLLERTLIRMDLQCRHEASTMAAAIYSTRAAVIICSPDMDWRGLLASLRLSREIAPPVILLLEQPDASLWAEAMIAGAFDVLVITASHDALAESIRKAIHRSQRARLVREALRQNTGSQNLPET